MDWLHPQYFWVFALVPVAAGLAVWAARRRAVLLARFGDRELVARLTRSISLRRRRWKSAAVVVAAGLLCLALVGPRFGTQVREVKREGVDLVIALDVSLSMYAEDVAPSRLERAKNEIKRLLDDMSGDRVGLVLFAGDAFLQCPLTSDYSAVKLFLDVANPALIPTPGTDFVNAMRVALEAFERGGGSSVADQDRTRALLFVSDGENHIDGVDAMINEASGAGVVIFAAGVGETGGVPIPTARAGNQASYKTDRQGRVVTTRLEEDVLKRLSGNGAYFRIARTASSLGKITTALDRLEQTELASEEFEEYDEKFQWPLVFGILILIAESLVPDRTRRREEWPTLDEADHPE